MTKRWFIALALAAAPGIAASAPPDPTQALDSERVVAALCEALTPTERLSFKGDAVQRAEAEERHARGLERALEGRYAVSIPGKVLQFAPYDEPGGRLGLSERGRLTALGGALQLWSADGTELSVEADPATARRVVAAQRAGRLSLRVTFLLPEEGPYCTTIAGSRQYTLAMAPTAWELADGAAVLARGGEGASGPAGGKPSVRVSSAVLEGLAADAGERLATKAPELLACYATALRREPALDGSMVVEVSLKRDGAPETVRIVADSVLDPDMAVCVSRVAKTVAFRREGGSGGPAGPRAQIPVHFEREGTRG